jgi:hypothetical protein
MTHTVTTMADNIKRNLTKNGFPVKSVSLPLERLYESAHTHGLNFNKVLEALEQDGIVHEKTAEKIIFSSKKSMRDMMAEAQDMMKNMTPDQLREIQQMVERMSPEEKEQMMRMAREMGPF